MTDTARPVDIAMSQDRPEKKTMRSLWIEKVKLIASRYPSPNVPWYFTLSGAEGRDIQSLIDEGLISLTEIGTIANKDQDKLVAVERNLQAVVVLNRKFIGLDIIAQDFSNIICGTGNINFPGPEHIKKCKAHIINLDLDSALVAKSDEKRIIFPVLEWIKKLSAIHLNADHSDWILCLTLNAGFDWDENVNNYVLGLISKNIEYDTVFAESCRSLFGEQLFSVVYKHGVIQLSDLPRIQKQKLIMVIVPKIISKSVLSDGWKIHTEHNLYYGNEECAPMVSWIIRFALQPQTTLPDTIYRTSIRDIFSNIKTITDSGEISGFQTQMFT